MMDCRVKPGNDNTGGRPGQVSIASASPDPYPVSSDALHGACCKSPDEIETLVVMGPRFSRGRRWYLFRMASPDDTHAHSLAQLKGTIVLAGAGKMGGAMLSGWLEQGLGAKHVAVIEPHPSDEISGLAARGIHLNPLPKEIGA